MRQRPRTRKVVARVFAAACLLYLLTLAIVQIGQHVLRHRAERLLADLRQLHDGGNTWLDMQRLMTRWGKYGHYDGTCTAQQCVYQIALFDWIGEDMLRSDNPITYAALRFLVRAFHWHAASLFTELNAKDGRVVEWRTEVGTEVPPGYAHACGEAPCPEYTLMISVSDTNVPASTLYWHWPGSPPSQSYGMEPFHRCPSCLRIQFKPSTPSAVVQRLTDFNMDCITQWSPCINSEEAAPTAWSLFQNDERLRNASNARADHCGFSIEEMTRASQLILRVSIIGDEARPPSYRAGVDPSYPARLLEIIHGTSKFKPGDPLQVNAEWEGTQSLSVKRNEELILLEESDFDPAETAPCGTIPATPENLARVHRAARGIPPNQQ